jgi:hypothetical protein
MRNPFRREAVEAERSAPVLSFNDYLGILNSFSFNGTNYSLNGSPQEEINGNFVSMARGAYKSDSVVFACMLARRSLFRQARFQWQRVNNGRLGDLFGDQSLSPLEKPWPNGNTAGLLGRAIDMVDLGGNFYATRNLATGGINWLRPDWTHIVAGNPGSDASLWDPDTEVIGYRYQPGGPGSGEEPIFYLSDEVAHWAPIPDPESRFLGMSWLTPVIREVMADKAMTEHKLKFMENAATPNLVVKINSENLDKFTKWMQRFKEDHEGMENAYRTIFLGAGADVSVVGSNLQQIDFKVTQGAGETRIAAAAGVPPVIVGLSEGLQAATYSNYGQARRRFADGTMWDLWNDFCGAISPILTVPGGAQLSVDGTSIPFLREDEADVATIQFTNAQAIKQLTDAGYTAESVVQAITANDLTKLSHTGLFSVQLLPPGSKQPPPDAPPADGQQAKPKPPAPAPTRQWRSRCGSPTFR